MKVKEQITLYVLINLKSNLKTSQHTNLYFICAKSTSVVDALQLPSPILCPRVTAILGITFEKKSSIHGITQVQLQESYFAVLRSFHKQCKSSIHGVTITCVDCAHHWGRHFQYHVQNLVHVHGPCAFFFRNRHFSVHSCHWTSYVNVHTNVLCNHLLWQSYIW
jgi:hypothetical protein